MRDNRTSSDLSKPALRKLLRERRRSLSSNQQRDAALLLCQRVLRSNWFARSNAIAFYLANDGEIDTSPLLRATLAAGKTCLLPRIVDQHAPQMSFAIHHRGDTLRRNRFGIAEPTAQAPVMPATDIDLILMPLVGFDIKGNRLGMGGGFYDRSLSYKRSRPKARPLLVGLAYDFQCVETLPAQPWDIGMDAVMTDRATYRFRWHP